jgi:type 1 glutamine amidotransferase
MPQKNVTTRRHLLKSGVATLAAAAAPNPLLAYKAPGEVRVIYHGGDFWHNPVTQEIAWKRVLGPAGWRLMFAQAVEFLTPEALAETDLLILCRYGTVTDEVWNLPSGNLTLGFNTDRLVEDRPTPSSFLNDELEAAIIANVRRGMGFLAVHCTVWNGERQKFMDLLGVKKPIMHTKVQPARIHNLNQNHPITQGIQPFDTGDDEIFNAEMQPGKYELLFNTSGEEQKVTAVGGWCREEGKGRVAALLPGHLPGPYMQVPYNEIMWRAAHWALRKDIPPSGVEPWTR